MDNEQSVNLQNTEREGGIGIVDIFNILRANWLLIIIVTVLFAAGGFLYSKVRKPVYTASVPVQFEVEMKAVDKDGEYVDQVSSTNYLFAYLDTAVGFCKSGEVLDRANVYYHYYQTSGMKIDEFITKLSGLYDEETKALHGEIEGYPVDDALKTAYRDKWFTSSNVGTNYNSSKQDTVINFRLWVKNLNPQYAKEMARIYALAADVALNINVDFGDKTTAGIVELNNSSSGVSLSSDVAAQKMIIIATLIGFILSCVVIYILHLSDNTVKSKEQLEKMVGANVIAYIDDVAEVK